MIFTSLAAAALAALTGMTTIRTPGGNEQQVQVQPASAIELTVADFSNPKRFERELELAIDSIPTGFNPKMGQTAQDRLANIAAKEALTNFRDGLALAGIQPVQVLYFNAYSVQEIGPRLHKLKVDVLEKSVITFVDKFGETVSFVDDSNVPSFPGNTPKNMHDDVFYINSGIETTGKASLKVVWEKFANMGLLKYDEVKIYEDDFEGPFLPGDDNTLPPPIDWRDWIIETMSIGIIDKISELLKTNLQISADIVDVMTGNYAMSQGGVSVQDVLAAYSVSCALDEIEFNMGVRALDAAQLTSIAQASLDMNFDALMANNDLSIVY